MTEHFVDNKIKKATNSGELAKFFIFYLNSH